MMRILEKNLAFEISMSICLYVCLSICYGINRSRQLSDESISRPHALTADDDRMTSYHTNCIQGPSSMPGAFLNIATLRL